MWPDHFDSFRLTEHVCHLMYIIQEAIDRGASNAEGNPATNLNVDRIGSVVRLMAMGAGHEVHVVVHGRRMNALRPIRIRMRRRTRPMSGRFR